MIWARVLPWLLVLPAFGFATPFSPLIDDPYPHLAGTGWAALLLLPLGVFLPARGARLGGAWPFLCALGWALLAGALVTLHDTFEARRALLGMALLPAAFAGGARLDANGRRLFAWLVVGLSCAWTALALGAGIASGEFAGLLGDTGSLSQAALPGAAIGAAWLVRETRARRALGGLALGLFLLHAAAAPVLAGGHTLLAALGLTAWRAGDRGRGAWLALALAALLAPFLGMAARQRIEGRPPSLEGAPAGPSHSLGGLGVRGLVWTSALVLFADHPLSGAGPGQFQAAFPPHREPREIELSRHGVCSELDTEVEHAHNDWLQGFVELGLIGGGLFALGLALAARSALGALASDERLPLAMAALALLTNAFVHAPLTANPAASVLAMAVFGSLVSDDASSARPANRWVGALLALPILLGATAALPLVRVGQALREHVSAARELEHAMPGALAAPGSERELVARLRAAVERACAAAPDAVPALILAARETNPAPEAWDRVLDRRPGAVEAWEQSGTQHARAGHTAEARRRYERALELSPTHPRILRNRARLECTQGELELGLAAIERLQAQTCLEPAWKIALGSELVLSWGLPERGARVLFDQPLVALSPEALHARWRDPAIGSESDDDSELAACESLAQLLWAREHAAAGAFDLALRNYRQAAERSRARRGPEAGPAPLYALELAAAEVRARRNEGHAPSDRPPIESTTWSELPDWARETLLAQGWVEPRRP